MFGPHRLHRCMTAFFVVLALLFSQLALAGYVCPGTPDAESMAEKGGHLIPEEDAWYVADAIPNGSAAAVVCLPLGPRTGHALARRALRILRA